MPDLARRAALFVLALALAAVGAPRAARGNGRFPAARYFIAGPGESGDVLALAATFGLVRSDDGGRSWRWVCETALGYDGTFDPSLVVAADRSILVTLPTGLSRARPPYCRFERSTTLTDRFVVDVAHDPRGRRVVAGIYDETVGRSAVAVSDDDGASWRIAWETRELFLSTLEVAPGNPARIYAGGWLAPREDGGPLRGGVVFRSDDGGTTFDAVTRDLRGAVDAFIAGVDATRPGTVYVRAHDRLGDTMLLRSDDGGETFRELTRTSRAMLGFALAPDGRRLWVSTNAGRDGILRSRDGGESFQPVPTPFGTLCLRFHGGALYACADQIDGFALARSTDDGDTFVPVLRFPEIQGPDACPRGTPARDACELSWPSIRGMLLDSSGDAGPGDAARDAQGPRLDAGGRDGGIDAGLDGGAVVAGGGACACRAVPARGGAAPALSAAIALAAVARRRRRVG